MTTLRLYEFLFQMRDMLLAGMDDATIVTTMIERYCPTNDEIRQLEAIVDEMIAEVCAR